MGSPRCIALSPGGADATVKAGGALTETQGSISLEQLLSKFIFSVTDTLTRTGKTPVDHAESGHDDAP